MTESEVQRAAEFLAARALLVLGLGIVAAAAALAAVVGSIRLLRRNRQTISGGFSWLLGHVRRIDAVERALDRTKAIVPSGYLALHLLLGLALTAAISVFVVIAEDVVAGGELVAFDLAFARALRDSATPGWERVFAAVSWLGKGETLAVAAVAMAIRLMSTHSPLLAAGWIAAQAGGGVLNHALKVTFGRTRPDYADPLLAASSWSFPSGHAMGTFVLVGLGCYILLRDIRSWTVAGIVVAVSLSWCIVMAFSRLYLGAHFASDVIAGVVAGVAWVAVCASGFEMVRKRRGSMSVPTR